MIASVLLIAFVVGVASITAPFLSQTLRNTQEGNSEAAEKLLDSSNAAVSIEQLTYDEESGNYTATVANTGSRNLTNISVTVIGGQPYQKRTSRTLEPGDVSSIEISTDPDVQKNSLRVSDSRNLVMAREELDEDEVKEVSGENPESSPSAAFSYSPSNPVAGETISFDGSGSSDSDGSITVHDWDWTDDSSFEASGETSSHSYGSEGSYTVRLRVTDDDSNTGSSTKTVDVKEALAVTGFAPANESSSVNPDSEFNFTFNREVERSSGSFELFRSDDTSVESVPADGSGPGTTELVTSSETNDTVEVDPDITLTSGESYYWTADDGSIVDGSGYSWGGISTDQKYKFTVETTVNVIDDFEDGDISEYSGATGSYTVDSSEASSGSSSLHVNDGSAGDIRREDFTVSGGEKVRFDLKVNSDSDSNDVYVKMGDSSGYYYRFSVNGAGDEHVRIGLRNSNGDRVDEDTTSENLPGQGWNTWGIELGEQGGVEVLKNGATYLSLPDDSNAPSSFEYIEIGQFGGAPDQNIDYIRSP